MPYLPVGEEEAGFDVADEVAGVPGGGVVLDGEDVAVDEGAEGGGEAGEEEACGGDGCGEEALAFVGRLVAGGFGVAFGEGDASCECWMLFELSWAWDG